MPTIADKRRAFRNLHESGCFVLPNPWDVGSARYLQHLGFRALATTSAGAAFAMGFPDSDRLIPRDAMLAHVHALADACDVPLNVDFGSGYAREPADVAANVRLCTDAGVAGLSIEDATGDHAAPLRSLDHAVACVRAARRAIDAAGTDVVLTARAERFAARQDLDDVLRRLRAFADAGADCLFAPGLATREQIAAVVRALAPKPVNVLVGAPGFTVQELADLGVRRISVGSALARTAWAGFARAAREIADAGRFDGLAAAMPHAALDGFFRDDLARRGA